MLSYIHTLQEFTRHVADTRVDCLGLFSFCVLLILIDSNALHNSPIGLSSVVGSGVFNFSDIFSSFVLNLFLKYFSSRSKPLSDLRSTTSLRKVQYSAQPTFFFSAKSL